jgi:hypothetical protein
VLLFLPLKIAPACECINRPYWTVATPHRANECNRDVATVEKEID